MSNPEEDFWKEKDRKGKSPSFKTPKRAEANRPAEGIAQASIASALKYTKSSPPFFEYSVGASASTNNPGPTTRAATPRQETVKANSASPAVPSPARDRVASMFSKAKVSSQARSGTSSAQGRKSDTPLKIAKVDKPVHVVDTPTKAPSKASRPIIVHVIDSDSSEDEVMEVPTDVDRRQQRRPDVYPLHAESSQSSVDSTASMFSTLQVSYSTSSIESIDGFPEPAAPKTPASISGSSSTSASTVRPAPPSKVDDIFSSPNVTLRRQTPKRGTKAPFAPAVPPTPTRAATPANLTALNATIAPAVPAIIAQAPVHAPAPSVVSEAPKQVPDSVLAFSKSAIGTELDVNIIAHCDDTQALFDRYRIAWGTQYELSRGVISGAWTWEDVRSKIQKLKGTNADVAGKVRAIMRGVEATSLGNVNLWKEMDREQLSIEENEHRGLGLRGEFEGVKNWYGGQIQQLGRLVKTEAGYFKITLEGLEKRRSHRFARYYGSRRFLQVKIPTALLQEDGADEGGSEEVKKFLMKKFVLCGRVFVPFHSKEEGLYMVETDEDYGRRGASWGGDAYRMSFSRFINWHNPIVNNYDQVISKYATRFALGLSNSVPALEFEEENIFFIDDITSEDWPKGKPNPPADKLMTDGCGFMNHAALQKIVQHLGLESIPAGVQGRIDGSKGFWILDPSDKSPSPRIWIRTSQHKIKNISFDRAHRIFDHLGPSKPTPPSAITAQSIINLCSNNIPQELLVKRMEDGLAAEIEPFLNWDGPDAMLFLAQAINKTGNVTAARTQRLATSLNRALGLKGSDWGVQYVGMEEEEERDDDDTVALTGRNKYSGGASSFNEMALEMVQAGFNPRYSKYLSEKIKHIISSTIDSTVEKYRIPIEESLGAYVVPDPLNVLGEGEIYYRFSVSRKNPRTDMHVNHLEGDVVVGRYPIRLPSDMQRVTAVNHPALEKWPDVVIVSTQGTRSLASLLADGDMDGDELIAIWDPEIVQHFQSKPFTSPPADLMERNFDRDVVKAEDFCRRTAQMAQKDASEAFQAVLLANLTQNKVGLYSLMHDNAVIKFGYGHPEAIRLAYIFNTLLDAAKSGRRLKAGIFDADKAKHLWGKVLGNPKNPDILTVLREAGQQKGRDLTSRYESALKETHGDSGPPRDVHLRKPYKDEADYALDVCNVAPQFSKDLALIRQHVDTAHQLWKDACDKDRVKKATTPSPTKKGSQPKKKGARKDIVLAATRAYAAPIEGVKMVRQLDQVKASYAYERSETFGFSMAFQELCHIKAMSAPGGIVANLRMFDEAKTFAPAFMRTLTRRDDDYFG